VRTCRGIIVPAGFEDEALTFARWADDGGAEPPPEGWRLQISASWAAVVLDHAFKVQVAA